MLWDVRRIKYVYRIARESVWKMFFYGHLCAARTSSWQLFCGHKERVTTV